MSLLLLAALQTAEPEIVITASLQPVFAQDAGVSVSTFDADAIQALGKPFALDYIRLAPGASVSVAGAPGSQTQIRIRGAEANQSLIFIDGIAFNDVASDNQPRFETFAADGLSRIEILRGPQSALWGSEAMGGVIALETPSPLGGAKGSALLEYGSLESYRAAGAFASGGERLGVSGTASWSRSDGIDVLGDGIGDRDGYESYNASLKGVFQPVADAEFGLVGHYIHHDVAFDGVDANFLRADTAEAQVAETYAVRGWARIGLAPDSPWSFKLEGQYLDSESRNRDGAVQTNDSIGKRTRIGGQLARHFAAGTTRHALIGGIEREDEDYLTRDLVFGGGGDVDYTRGRTAYVGEWRADWGDTVTTDVAVRHDNFNRFRDETTVRANAIVRILPRLAIVGGYGEGIAQPGFAELFGYARSSGFVGNPALTPEKSQGYEAGLQWSGRTVAAKIVGFSNALRDEIVYRQLTPWPASTYTYVNADGKSRRRGVEVSGEWHPVQAFSLSANYTFLDAREADGGGAAPQREIRRPRHMGNLVGTWARGPFSASGSLSYAGKRRDTDFDTFNDVTLGDYILVGARAAFALTPALEAFGRIENAGDARYQDQVGYATPGRSVYAGLRLRLGN